jgi:hypothetical protein
MDLVIEVAQGLGLLANVDKAFVVFVPGRGKARAKSIPGGMQRMQLSAKDQAEWSNVLAYAAGVPGGLPLAGGLSLAYRVDTERILPAYLILVLANDEIWKLSIDAVSLRAGTPVLEGGSLLAAIKGPLAYLKEQWDTLDCKKNPARCFFADLDRRTHPQLIDACHALFPSILPRKDLLATRLAVSSLMTALGEQLKLRATLYGGTPMPSHLHAHLHNHASFISRMFLRLAADYFPTRGGINLPAFEDAFERFALGELALTLPSGFTTTQPSSGYIVFFSEIALFCRVAGVDASEWGRLLNVLVRIQEAFFRVHTLSSGAPQTGIGHYGPHTYDAAAAARFRTDGHLASLRTTYAAHPLPALSQLSASSVQTFLPDLLYPPAAP